MLDLIQGAISTNGFTFQRIDGKSSLEDRKKAMRRFNEDPQCTVMLASIGSAGEGQVEHIKCQPLWLIYHAVST